MNKSLANGTHTFLIALAIIGIATALRLYHINYQSLWYDELHSIIPTDPANTLRSVIEYSKTDQPPLFFIYLYYFFELFGYNELVGRVAAAILGILAVPVMYLLGKEVKGERVGIAAALFTSLNYMHIYYSQELRFYSMAFLLTCLSFLFLIKAYKAQKFIDFFFYILFTTSLLYTHYYGLVIYAVQVLIYFVLLIFFRRGNRFVFASAISGLIVGILFLPWLPVLTTDLGIESFWIRRPEATFIFDYFYYYFGKDAVVTALFIFLTAVFVKVLFSGQVANAAEKPLYVIIVVWLVFSYLIPYLKSLVGAPVLYVRYTIVSLPAWILIFAIGLDLLEKVNWKKGVVVIACLSMLLNLFIFRGHYSRVQKQQFREVAGLVRSLNTENHPIYSIYPWHFAFYFKDTQLELERLESGIIPKTDTFWLMQAEFFSPQENEKVIEPLLTEYQVVERYPFYKTEAILLERIK